MCTEAGHARVALSFSEDVRSGVALDIDLSHRQQGYEIEPVVDFIRARFALEIESWSNVTSLPRDCHQNVIVAEELTDLSDPEAITAPGDTMRGLSQLLAYALGPVYPDVGYEVLGFMLLSEDACRLYIHTSGEGRIGLQVPLTAPGVGALFADELDTLARMNDFWSRPRIDEVDDYCTALFDMSMWVDPPTFDLEEARRVRSKTRRPSEP